MLTRRTSRMIGFLLLLVVVLATAACGADPTPGSGPPLASPVVSPAQPQPPAPQPPAPEPPPAVAPARPFVPTTEDHLSTFGLDVDTGSYTAARNYLNAGQLPPPETVRVEEFVNYFHYDYPPPERDAFGIYIDSAPSPAGAPGTQIVRIGLQGRAVDPAARRPAVLTFVIDTSGSMEAANRLPLVKDALHTLVDALSEQDQVAIVAFSDEARLVLDHTSAGRRETLHQAIDSLQPGGSTYAEAGLQLGYELAGRHFAAGAINRVILCSDGVANVGATGPEAILQTVRNYTAQGVVLTTVGFGMGDYNDHLMEQLADQGNGQYAYVDAPDAARRLFVEQLTGTLQVIATEVKVQVDFNPTVVSRYRLLGYENRAVADPSFRQDQVDAGEVGAGHSVTALYEVALTEQSGAALTVLLRYADPRSGEVHELRQLLDTGAMGRDLARVSPRLQLAVAAAGFAEQLQRPGPDADPALAHLTTLTQGLLPQVDDPDVAELAQLMQRAREIGNRTGWVVTGSVAAPPPAPVSAPASGPVSASPLAPINAPSGFPQGISTLMTLLRRSEFWFIYAMGLILAATMLVQSEGLWRRFGRNAPWLIVLIFYISGCSANFVGWPRVVEALGWLLLALLYSVGVIKIKADALRAGTASIPLPQQAAARVPQWHPLAFPSTGAGPARARVTDPTGGRPTTPLPPTPDWVHWPVVPGPYGRADDRPEG